MSLKKNQIEKCILCKRAVPLVKGQICLVCQILSMANPNLFLTDLNTGKRVLNPMIESGIQLAIESAFKNNKITEFVNKSFDPNKIDKITSETIIKEIDFLIPFYQMFIELIETNDINQISDPSVKELLSPFLPLQILSEGMTEKENKAVASLFAITINNLFKSEKYGPILENIQKNTDKELIKLAEDGYTQSDLIKILVESTLSDIEALKVIKSKLEDVKITN